MLGWAIQNLFLACQECLGTKGLMTSIEVLEQYGINALAPVFYVFQANLKG